MFRKDVFRGAWANVETPIGNILCFARWANVETLSDRKHNVSATMFLTLPKALESAKSRGAAA